MPKLSLEVRDALAIRATAQTQQRIDETFEDLCVELVSDWLLGTRRFERTSQQMEYWLSRLYEEIYSDEQPDATRIYQRFRMPLPRAQYMARLLIARRAAHWRTAARTELKNALEGLRTRAEEAVEGGAGATQRYEASLSRGAFDELIVIYEDICGGLGSADRPAPPRKLPGSPLVMWFSITAEAVVAILGNT